MNILYSLNQVETLSVSRIYLTRLSAVRLVASTYVIVSQGYDGASVMSGACSGVQQRIKQVVPHAVYIHCYAHTLNLVLVDSVKMIPSASDFFFAYLNVYVVDHKSTCHFYGETA